MKKLWFATNALLLALSLISWVTGASDLFGYSVTILIVLSYPLNLLVGWLFFAFDVLNQLPIVTLLMAFVMSALGYVQWFQLVPSIAGFFRRKLSSHDLQIKLTVEREGEVQLTEGDLKTAPNWQEGWYDKHANSPVERILGRDE